MATEPKDAAEMFINILRETELNTDMFKKDEPKAAFPLPPEMAELVSSMRDDIRGLQNKLNLIVAYMTTVPNDKPK
jgi:hypothetical protein